jgi:hypothetical protein
MNPPFRPLVSVAPIPEEDAMKCLAIGLLILVLGGFSAALAGPEVPLIRCPADPPTVEIWQLVEVWRLGGDDPDAPLMGVIGSGCVDAAGNVLLLDQQLGHVLVVSPEGEYLGTLGGQGEGPGEVQSPEDLIRFSDGTLGLVQAFPPKIVRLTADGTPQPNIKPAGSRGLFWRVRESAGVLVVSGQVRDYSQPTSSGNTYRHFIARLSPEGEALHTYLEKTTHTSFDPPVFDEEATFFPTYAWDLTADGTLVLARERDRYRLEFISPDGELQRVSERPFTPWHRTDEDRQKRSDEVIYTVGGEKVDVKTHIMATDEAIRSLQVMADGSIWVSSCYGNRELPEGVYRRYDVLAPAGDLLAEVRIVCAADSEEDSLMPLENSCFLWIKNAASAAQAMYAGMPGNEDDEAAEPREDEDSMLEVIYLTRAR